jgi:hypothetical protein
MCERINRVFSYLEMLSAVINNPFSFLTGHHQTEFAQGTTSHQAVLSKCSVLFTFLEPVSLNILRKVLK